MDRHEQIQYAMAIAHQAMEGAGAWADNDISLREALRSPLIGQDIEDALTECLSRWDPGTWSDVPEADRRVIIEMAKRLHWETIKALRTEYWM